MWLLFSLLILVALFKIMHFHVLNILLLFELGILTSLLLIRFSLSSIPTLILLLLEFFTFAVCEACLGIGVLIKCVRRKGNDLRSQIL